MASMAREAEESARRANEVLHRNAVISSQRRTADTLTEIRDTLIRIEQLLLGSTTNGESSETKGHSI